MPIEDAADAPERRAARERAMLTARLTWGNGDYSLDATVTQISASGCQLSVEASDILPVEFAIDVPRRAIARRAHVVWRTPKALAVKFIDAPEAPTATPQKADEDKMRALAEQIDHLKGENENLRREIAKIRGRLPH